jgi:hypothetical protein
MVATMCRGSYSNRLCSRERPFCCSSQNGGCRCRRGRVRRGEEGEKQYAGISYSVFRGLHQDCKKNLVLYNKTFESWAKHKNKASSKNHQRRKSNLKASGSTYQDHLQDYIQKNEFATNHGVCDESSKKAEKNIVCVHCSACVHPLPDYCRIYGNQLSCIDCYRRRHVIFVPHTIRDGGSSQLLAKKDTASNDVKTPPESNEKARLGKGWNNEDKNDKVAKKDGTAQDLKAAHQSNDAAERKMIGDLRR